MSVPERLILQTITNNYTLHLSEKIITSCNTLMKFTDLYNADALFKYIGKTVVEKEELLKEVNEFFLEQIMANKTSLDRNLDIVEFVDTVSKKYTWKSKELLERQHYQLESKLSLKNETSRKILNLLNSNTLSSSGKSKFRTLLKNAWDIQYHCDEIDWATPIKIKDVIGSNVKEAVVESAFLWEFNEEEGLYCYTVKDKSNMYIITYIYVPEEVNYEAVASEKE